MSQYFTILAKKDDIEITLLCRGISTIRDALPSYTENDILLSNELRNKIMFEINNKISTIKSKISDLKRLIRHNEDLIIRCQSTDVAHIYKDDNIAYDEYITELKEDLETWQYFRYEMEYIGFFKEDNTDWDLYYSLG